MATKPNSGYTMLRDMAVSSTVKIVENGTPVEFYVAKHNYEADLNGAGRTLLVRKNVIGNAVFDAAGLGRYATSPINTYLENMYKKLFSEDVQLAMGSTTFYYTPGNNDYTMTTLTRSVFLLSAREWGGTSNSNASYNHEGTPIGAAFIDSDSAYWTRTVSTRHYSLAQFITYSNSKAYVENSDCKASKPLRPAFTLPDTTLFRTDGTISFNRALTITSNVTDGADLGTKAESFALTYTVTDADSDAVTIKEYFDGVVQRTYTATLGATNTFERVNTADFQKILNGSHTIKIEATDGYFTATLTATFEKKVTQAVITLKKPLAVAGDINAAVLIVTAELPKDAVYKVEVTNNANDARPVWQDATTEVNLGQNILFTNSVCTNGAAFNFRITAGRGPSDEAGNISVVSGAFQ